MKTPAKFLLLGLLVVAHVQLAGQNVELQNASDQVKIRLTPDGNDNGGQIQLYAPDLTRTFDVGGNSETDQGSYVNMYRGDGQRSIQMDADHFGGGEIYLNNTSGQRAIELHAHDANGVGASVDLFDETGTRRLRMATDEGLLSSALFRAYLPNGNESMVLGTNAFTGSEFRLRDALGTDRIIAFGNPGTGGYHLSVDGNIISEEVRVLDSANWPDYVFSADYPLPTIEEYARQIQTDGHMPGIPPAAQIAQEGIALAEMVKRQMEKIEELTLYIIQLNERICELEAQE